MRTFILLALHGKTTPEFSLDDLPGAGKLDTVCRTITNTLYVSQGIRNDTIMHVVLNGPKDPPRLITIDGSKLITFSYDERSVAKTIRDALAKSSGILLHEQRQLSPGIIVAKEPFETLVKQYAGRLYYLHKRGVDVRSARFVDDPVFVFGDIGGLPDKTEKLMKTLNAERISLGPKMLFASQCSIVIHNELDRRAKANPSS
ncbi:tRNA (pseudouridine(54)-N(1))-methyltransferase TrmY [Candidatus Woesearchaeota archaeon]|nr:tRNA (pseudouridine(54)-N(1))-methyltransferase TrmY [Candidatus Woesearchaeota archaeon]